MGDWGERMGDAGCEMRGWRVGLVVMVLDCNLGEEKREKKKKL